LPSPPPLRTARAGFLACRSSIGQRIRDDTRWPHWPWGQPGRYYGRAGCRDDFGGGCSTSKGRCDPADSCITASAGWLTVHARRHLREVGPLSGGVMLQPLSGPLQVGLRFLPHPLPAAPSVGLAASLPRRGGLRAYHVPQTEPRGLGRASGPVALGLRATERCAVAPGHVPFGSSLSAAYEGAGVRPWRTPRGWANIAARAALHLG
jgi:hypothetical protein